MKVNSENRVNREQSSGVETWRKLLPQNEIVGWPKYEGTEVPKTDQERETARQAFLDAVWELRQTLSRFPRHMRYTAEQFNHGFFQERQQRWLPLVEDLIQALHLWRNLYPGIDITRRQNYEYLVSLKEEMSSHRELNPQAFERKLSSAAAGFRTSFQYCERVNDEVIVEKFRLLVEAFFAVSSHYSEDIESMLERERQPTQYFPAT